MDAAKFIKEKDRMCNSYNMCYNGCPIYNLRLKYDDAGCLKVLKDHTEEFVSEVEKWSEVHPAKTRKDDFLEKYPNAMLEDEGYPRVCARYVGFCDSCPDTSCNKCWNEPVEV